MVALRGSVEAFCAKFIIVLHFSGFSVFLFLNVLLAIVIHSSSVVRVAVLSRRLKTILSLVAVLATEEENFTVFTLSAVVYSAFGTVMLIKGTCIIPL